MKICDDLGVKLKRPHITVWGGRLTAYFRGTPLHCASSCQTQTHLCLLSRNVPSAPVSLNEHTDVSHFVSSRRAHESEPQWNSSCSLIWSSINPSANNRTTLSIDTCCHLPNNDLLYNDVTAHLTEYSFVLHVDLLRLKKRNRQTITLSCFPMLLRRTHNATPDQCDRVISCDAKLGCVHPAQAKASI